MKEKMMKLWKDEEGTTAVEYGVMVALVSAALVVSVGLMSDKLVEVFDGIVTALTPTV